MKSNLYQYPHDKVHCRLLSILRIKDYSIIKDDKVLGIIMAKKKGSLFRYALFFEIRIQKIDENTTNLAVDVKVRKGWFINNERGIIDVEEYIFGGIM